MSHRDLVHPSDAITETLERIYRYRMTTTSGGNLSIRDESGTIWITPARVDKGSIRSQDVVAVEASGTKRGSHPPSSEYPFHEAIYRRREDLRAIIHAHPVALVAFSVCGAVPDTRLLPQADQVCGRAGFAGYALPGSKELGERIADAFAEGFHSVVLENHGVVVGGATLDEAFSRFETLEFLAKTVIKAGRVGTVRPLSDEQLSLARQSHASLPTFEPESAETREKEIRRDLVRFIRRGYQQRLLTSTEGTFSARLDKDRFVISCHGIDRHDVTINELALIDCGRAEAGLSPSHAVRLHAAIYAQHPWCHSIVNAMPVNATAFSITDVSIDTRTIPESYLFLKDPAHIPFAEQYTNLSAAANRLSSTNPVALMQNNGVIVAGRDILDAFDRLEVLETTAESLINSRSIGELRSMSKARLDELIQAFEGKA